MDSFSFLLWATCFASIETFYYGILNHLCGLDLKIQKELSFVAFDKNANECNELGVSTARIVVLTLSFELFIFSLLKRIHRNIHWIWFANEKKELTSWNFIDNKKKTATSRFGQTIISVRNDIGGGGKKYEK